MQVNKRISYLKFKELMDTVRDPKDAALFATIYCSYGRIGEVVKNNPTCKPNPPLNKDNFEFTKDHLAITLLTEKTGRFRTVITSRSLEDWLHEHIRNYMSYCDYELFPHSTRWGEYRSEKWFGTGNIHLLRHWACTHALQGKRTRKRLKAYDVAQMGGWTNLDSFYKTYSHIVTADLKELV